MLSNGFPLFLMLVLMTVSCLKHKGGSDTKHHAQEGSIVIGSEAKTTRSYIVRKNVAGIFVDSRLDNSGDSLLAGSIIDVRKEADKIYSFPTLRGRRYFAEEYLPQGSTGSPYMSSLGLDYKFTDISGNPSHGYRTPATLPQLIKDANATGKRFVVLYFWSVCRGNDLCNRDTEHLVDFQEKTSDAQVFSIYLDLKDDGGRIKEKSEVAGIVRDWRESREFAKIPFPVLWVRGEDDNIVPDMLNCHNKRGKVEVPCAVFLDRCGLARKVLPCPRNDSSSGICVASFAGTALNFKDRQFHQKVRNVMASNDRCSY